MGSHPQDSLLKDLRTKQLTAYTYLMITVCVTSQLACANYTFAVALCVSPSLLLIQERLLAKIPQSLSSEALYIHAFNCEGFAYLTDCLLPNIANFHHHWHQECCGGLRTQPMKYSTQKSPKCTVITAHLF